jgi:predicted DNA-binding transcriptional regulator AlpA
MKKIKISMENPDELMQAFVNEFVNRLSLKNIVERRMDQEPELPVKIDKVMEWTGLKDQTIYKHCRNNTIPYHRKSGRLFFFKSEIIQWIKSGKQKTLKELKVDADAYLSKKDSNKPKKF